MKKIAVLIPCYNESKTIGKVIADFSNELPEADIYVYDNNSNDGTDKVAIDSGAILKYVHQQGKGNVIRSMFRDIDADCYLMVDGDDTYPSCYASEMCRFVLEESFDMVIGDRLSSDYTLNRLFHNSGNKLVRRLINVIFESDIKDIMTGYRALSKPFVKCFPALSHGFEIETEMTIYALDKELRIKNVVVQYRNRPDGSVSKLNTFIDGLKVVLTIFRLFRDYRPLRFFILLSSFSLFVSFCLFAPVFVEYLKTGLVPRFPTLIVSGMCALFSFMLFLCGVILEVLHMQQKQLFEILLKNIKRE